MKSEIQKFLPACCVLLALSALHLNAAQGGGTPPAGGGAGGGAPAVNPIAQDLGDRVPTVLNGKYHGNKEPAEDGVVGHLVTASDTFAVITSNDEVLKKLAQSEGKQIALQGNLEEPDKDKEKNKDDKDKEPPKDKEKKFFAQKFMDGIQTTADISNPRGL